MKFLDRFDRPDEQSVYWFNSANDLHAGAAATWHSMEPHVREELVAKYELGASFDTRVALYPVYGLLCGLSVELLLKASIVESGMPIKNEHNLIRLASQLQLQLDSDQMNLLEQLTHLIRWRGRYPKPNKREEWMKYRQVQDDAMVVERTGKVQWRKQSASRTLNWNTYDALWKNCLNYYCSLSKQTA